MPIFICLVCLYLLCFYYHICDILCLVNKNQTLTIVYYEKRESKRAKSPVAATPTAEQISQVKNYRVSGQYYCQPMYRLRPQYTQDSSKHTNESEHFTPCNKDFMTFKNKTGYIEVFRCLNHRMCIGFHIGDQESINDIFSVLFQYWKTPPKVCVADFQCNAAVYISNREPEHFKEMVNIVDQFHSTDHVQCSPAVNAKYFKMANHRHSLMNDSGSYLSHM